MGVRRVRMEGHKQPVTELLPPLEPGAPERRTAEGHKLWNPYWLKPTAVQEAENAKFRDAVVSTVVTNAKAMKASVSKQLHETSGD